MNAIARTVVLDVDSTLSGIEGVDWLAERRGPAVAAAVQAMTAAAMDGERPLEEVFGARLDLIRPRRSDLAALADAYREALAPGATGAVAAGLALGVRWVLVSGGLRAAILPMAAALGLHRIHGAASGAGAGRTGAARLRGAGGGPARGLSAGAPPCIALSATARCPRGCAARRPAGSASSSAPRG